LRSHSGEAYSEPQGQNRGTGLGVEHAAAARFWRVLRLFPLDPPERTKGQRRVIPTYSDEQRAAFRRTEEVIARIRPSWLPENRKLCAGCGKVIYRDLRNTARLLETCL